MPHTRAGLHILIVAPGRHPAATIERAILRLRDEQRMPHEIHVVASRERLTEVQRELLGAAGGFSAVCAAAGFARDEILFNQRTLHVVGEAGAGSCSGDADRILVLLRQLSSADDAALTVVIGEGAGAGAYVVLAGLQIAGRIQDRLLLDVSTSAPRGRTAECRYLELPLLLWPANEPPPQSYGDAVKRRRTERVRIARPDVMRLDVRRRSVTVGETTVTLPGMQFFWLYYLASTTGERLPLAELSNLLSGGRRQPMQLTQKLPDGRVRTFPADLQRAFVQVFPMAADKFDAMFLRSCGPHPGLPSTISKINAALRRALGRGAAPYLIQGGRGAGGYRLTLPPSGVQIVGVDPRRT